MCVTVTSSALTNTGIPQIGARIPLPGSLALGAQQDRQTRCGPLHFRFTRYAFGSVDPRLLSLHFRRWGPVGAYGS
jgi:hypothetical protein